MPDDFVYDGGSVPTNKVNTRPVTGPASRSFSAIDWNGLAQAAIDIRNALLNGKYHTLQEFAAAISAASKGTIRFKDGRFQVSENAGAYHVMRHPDVNVLSFGADPTGVADSSVAFMAAIASFGPSSGSTASYAGTIIVPPGKFRLASTVRVKKSVWIKGSHAAAGCVIVPDPGICAFKFERANVSTDLGTGSADSARISNLQIYNPSHKVGVWQQSHAYVAGNRVKVGPAPGQGAIPFTDIDEFYRHYECTTGGTSAASGTGPKSFGNDQTLNYASQSANFTVGDFVSGGSSGASGRIIADTDSGATGTLRITSWNGIAFQNGEALVDNHTGSAVASGTNAAAAANELDGAARWTYIGSGSALHIRANGVACQDMVIGGLSGAGVHIVGGDLESPGAFLNSNGWQFYGGSVTTCDGPAFYIRGSDANGGLCVGTAIGGNGGPSSDGDFTGPDYNIRDCGFLGNTWVGCEIYTVGGQGAVFTNSIGGGFCALGCYLEGTGGGPSIALNGAMVIGGGLSVADWRGSAGPAWSHGSVVVLGPGGSLGLRSKIVGYGGNVWRSSSFIPVGIQRQNGGNVYQCVTAGTTASSGGPTGTGTGITDGSCVWDFVAAVSSGEGTVSFGSNDPTLQIVHSAQSPDDVSTGFGAYDRFVANSGQATNVRVNQYGISGPNPASFEGNGLGRQVAINKTILTETPQKIPAGKELMDMLWLGGVRIMGTATAADPAAGTYSKGDLILYKRGAVSAGGAVGRRCSVEGTAGTYAGGRTATANGTTTVTVSGAAMSSLVDQQDFKVGDKLTINGVTSRVQSASLDGRTLVMGTAVTAGSGLAIAFSPPTWEEFGAAPAFAAVGSAPSANGATVSGQTVTLQPADGTHPGVLTAAGFTKLGNQSGTNTGDVTTGTANGLSLAGQVLSLALAVAAGAAGALSGSDKTKLDNTTGTNSGDATLAAVGASPSANGATLSGQVLTLQPADATHPGLLTILAQVIAGVKTFQDTVTSTKNGTAFACAVGDGHYLLLDAQGVGFWTSSSGGQLNVDVGGATVLGISSTGFVSLPGTNGKLQCKGLLLNSYTNGSGIPGAQTIDKYRGKFKIAAGGTSVTITNNNVDTDSYVGVVIETNDTTALLKNVVKAAGAFTVTLNAACTADTVLSFLIVN